MKSNYQRVWQRILIGYSPNTTKHLCIWVSQTKQVVIASKPYIDELEQGAKLLSKWLLETTVSSKKKAPEGEPRPRGRPRKQIAIEETLGETLDKIEEIAMSMTESGSKIYEPTSYDEAVNDQIHGRRWQEVIEDELQNLENHQTWEYDELLPGQKAIGLKWVFKVKYNPNGSIARFKARLVAQSFSQVNGIDFSETFAPTVRKE